MEKTLLAAKLTNNLFAKRDTIDEALDYVEVMLNATGNPADRAAYTTAVGVLCNTIANALSAMPDSAAAAATGFENALMKLIDARIKYCLDDMDLTSDLDDKIQEYIDNSVDFTEIVRDEIRQNISFTIEVD